MAKQTIIVMSDSHGDSLIVEEIRDRYVGKVDAVFITAILNCVLILLWKAYVLLKGTWTSSWLPRTFGDRAWFDQDYPNSWSLV